MDNRQNRKRPQNRRNTDERYQESNYTNYQNDYYDEYGYGSGQQPQDPYQQEYERQLNEFERMDGQNDNGDIDLEFHSYDEPLSNEYRQRDNYSRQSRQRHTNSGQRKSRSGSSTSGRSSKNSGRKHRNENLQFGNQNKYKYKNSEPDKKSRSSGHEKGQKQRMEKKRHPIKGFFKALFLIVLVLFIIFNILLIRYINCVNVVKNGERDSSISPSIQSKDVRNILVIGSDSRDPETNGRTDSMILLSINKATKETTMTSFMRDMYVEIKGCDSDGNPYDNWDKLNAAYVHGGAALLMDTIEYNFDIKVDDYVYIDFYSFVDIVDSIGGIELTVSDEEADGMTAPMAEQNKIMGKEHGTDYLTHGGTMLMNGNQVLAYARLRYVGNADFQRTERQREVMTKIIEKAKKSDPLTIDKFAKTSASNLVTNMSKTELYLLSYKILFSMNYSTNSLRIPDEGAYSYGEHNGQSTLDVDFDRCRELLKSNIYK